MENYGISQECLLYILILICLEKNTIPEAAPLYFEYESSRLGAGFDYPKRQGYKRKKIMKNEIFLLFHSLQL